MTAAKRERPTASRALQESITATDETSLRAAVRVRLTAADRDSEGWCTHDAENRVYALLCGVPRQVRVTVDLGSVRYASDRLVRILAKMVGPNLIIEAEDWRTVRDVDTALRTLRNREAA